MNDNKTNKTSDFSRLSVLIFSAIGTLATLVWVLRFSNYGLDYTDESFYLVWMQNPFNYSASVTQFGFIYHPLYLLLGGSIAALRQANILITFGLAWGLCIIFLKTIFANQSFKGTSQIVISGAIATASLIFLDSWVPTPSYNSLGLQALLVVATGLLLADEKISRISIVGWFLIGVGGWLSFMAKPTSAAALALCTIFYLLLSKKINVRLLALSLVIALCLLFFSALMIDGSIMAFIDRLKSGAVMSAMLGGGHTIGQLLRVDNFHFESRARYIFFGATLIIFFAAYLSQAQNKVMARVGGMLSIAFALFGLVLVFGITQRTLNAGEFQSLLLWSVPYAAIAVGFALFRFRGILQIPRPKWVLILTFLAFPHIFAFGTGNNYWVTGADAGIFWVLAGLVFLSPISPIQKIPRLLQPLSLAVQMISVVLIHTGIEAPYRQFHSLRENDYKLKIGKNGSALILSEGYGRYFTEAINLANHAGFVPGNPMIDLSGQSPGILYAIGASSIGQAWTIGGYSGSDKLAVAMLKKVSCEELARSWLLTEPDGPRKISSDIISSFGANISRDFKNVGPLHVAKGAGAYTALRIQYILKPIRSSENAIAKCIEAREGN